MYLVNSLEERVLLRGIQQFPCISHPSYGEPLLLACTGDKLVEIITLT
jgi:hypothetical protein